MITLGVHTAGGFCDVAILDGPRLIGHAREEMKRGHDARLPLLTQSAAQLAGIKLDQLDCVAVCVGPGSFTGIRVGVAFARGLALANSVQAVGVTSLEAMCADIAPDQSVLAVIPAKLRPPDQTFWSQQITGDETGDPTEEPLGSVLEIARQPLHLVTTSQGADILGAHISLSEVQVIDPTAESLARYSLKSGFKPRSPGPVYVREPDATPAKPLI
ncbi:MAG: tRNA (adenosine(37)-N6)-threonylcarbamoyltransferase complex dimerization subunit type 1 TsaB [Ponticaulis sp.]|nr:tRNA (adenosine(37)-N6)-threonylcarbamoyltransferase complex dimerization subunit type 1 TsaB [Ponticaulis sp.]